MRNDSIHYLKSAGFDFKPAESPDLWTHLEDHFAVSHRIGPRFSPLSASAITDLITRGENTLLDAMVRQHQRTGQLDRVEEMIQMPFAVGVDGTVAISDTNRASILDLIDRPGTAQERLIRVFPATPDSIPATHQVVVKGGLYPDGHTAGYFGLCPGSTANDDMADRYAWMATHADISALARDMEQKADDIALVTRQECAAMLAKVRKLLGN